MEEHVWKQYDADDACSLWRLMASVPESGMLDLFMYVDGERSGSVAQRLRALAAHVVADGF